MGVDCIYSSHGVAPPSESGGEVYLPRRVTVEEIEVECKPSNSPNEETQMKQLQALGSAADAKTAEGCNRRDWNRQRERVLEVTQDEPPKELITDVRKLQLQTTEYS